ncbi:MAG: GDP-mannose 4,6-dehydratase [Patescibacteria group bacterium]|nr:GDP-mannose 4,6-dehydratase [Patescibacteria group bacterium]
MKKALITGITGQDGAYLSKFLLDKGYEVFGLVRRTVNRKFENLEYLGVADKVNCIDGDLADESSLINAVKRIYPDEVYNLAAQSFVGTSWDQPMVTCEINSMGVLRLLNAIKICCPTAKFYQASTSEMFGNVHEKGIQDEETPFHPRSPYAISKLFAYWMTINYRESNNMFCSNGILFNHESPIRGKEFVSRKITDGVARIKLGLAKEIRLGNLDSERDWGFAGDYIEAMWLMLQQDRADDFIVSTGKTHSIKDFLDLAFDYVGIKNWQPYVKIDPLYKRPAELFTLQGKNNKSKKILGWKPKVTFSGLVKMMVDADLKRLSGQI